MQKRRFGSIGDLVKLAFLRHLQEGRHLAVCWCLTGQGANRPLPEKHFAYLKRPDEFRYLALEIFDTLKSVVEGATLGSGYITAMEASGLLNGAVFHHEQVPRRAALRKNWMASLVDSVSEADLIFLDPDNGMQGRRLTPRHVALAEIVALRRQDSSSSVKANDDLLIFSCSNAKAKILYNFLGNKIPAEAVLDRNGKFDNRQFGNNACYQRVEDQNGKATDEFRCDLILTIGDKLSD